MIQPHDPPLTVIGSWLSPYVRKVLAMLEFKGLPYLVDPIVPFYGNDDFARLSPARRIPVLIDNGFVVPDSTVICEYLEEKWPDPALMPSHVADRARMRALEEYADSVLGEVFIWRYFNQLVINRFVWDRQADAAILAKARDEDIPEVLDFLEVELPEAGTVFEDLSVADIAIASFFRNLGFARYTVDATRWPRTAGYVSRVLGLPCFTALAPWEQLSARTPISQHREALRAAGAPLSAESMSRVEPRRGILSK